MRSQLLLILMQQYGLGKMWQHCAICVFACSASLSMAFMQSRITLSTFANMHLQINKLKVQGSTLPSRSTKSSSRTLESIQSSQDASVYHKEFYIYIHSVRYLYLFHHHQQE